MTEKSNLMTTKLKRKNVTTLTKWENKGTLIKFTMVSPFPNGFIFKEEC